MRRLGYLLLASLLTLVTTGPARPAAPVASAPPPAGSSSSRAAPDSLAGRIRALLLDTVDAPGHRPLQYYDLPATRTFYQRRACAPAWCDSFRLSARGRAASGLLLSAEDYGLQPANYHGPAVQALVQALRPPVPPARRAVLQARLEVLLTDGLLRFTRHLRRGQLRELTPSPLEAVDSTFVPAVWLSQALAAPDFVPALLRCQPQQREYQQLQQALARWRRQPGGRDSARLKRAWQLALTLERWRWQAIPDTNYVLVNLPAYALEVVHRDSVLQTQRLVIGKPESPTPTFSSRLRVFTLAPEWRVPYSIATEELLPRLRHNPRYAARHRFAIYDAQGQPVDATAVDWWDVDKKRFRYTVRQRSGPGNALGSVIFRFANPYQVYLHATYDTHDFKRPYRALGHGCIRMEHPLQLADYLLRGADSLRATLPTEAELAAAPVPRRVTAERAVPLHVRYATCAVVGGQLRFYPDVYKQDEALRRQLFGR
ncbi:L,D-transpeptidase family protein [Hymenobacter sp. 5317J-9]|uniref:L,D-transpeptidase family protein n=1 Tax=Hymenobacter sp. 5317J-9 TaxID=2932250 RepID=UPI001FD667CD|nr:L,D-transpeptidase family protein [Hymenobacter sp. 5317J-9]UOQ97216.1 L,D-transpeptidase family protein [Hymenobacter sp. 5317J-9]